MTKKNNMDAEEQALLAAYERGEFRPVKNMKAEMAKMQAAAANYLRKNARINIRLAESDLLMLKRKAAEEGMPYQTLIASILHKFVSGRL
jgi:predicted DNA binding CopG/RHH family protein